MTNLLIPGQKTLPPARQILLDRLPRVPAVRAHPRQPRPTRWGRRLTLAAGSLLVALVLAITGFEIYLRSPAGATRFPALSNIYGFYAQDGEGSVKLIPGYRGTQEVEGRQTRVDINRLGMRGPEINAPRPGEFRVLFLGDSIPFGHGGEASEAFPAQVESLLSDEYLVSMVVGNAGVPGASHADQVRSLERHFDTFEPDLIVSCVYTGNDFDGDFFGPKKAIDGYWFGTEAARLIESSWRARLCLHLRTAFVFEQLLDDHAPWLSMDRSAMLPTAAEAARFAEFTGPRYEGLFMDAIEGPPIVDKVLDRMESTLAALRERAGRVPVMVAIVPSFAQTWNGIYDVVLGANKVDPTQFERGLGARRLAERCRDLEIACLDLTPSMAAHARPNSLYLPEDLHLSVEGNRFVAEQLAPRIARSIHPRITMVLGQAPRARWVGSNGAGPAPFKH